MRNLSVKIVVKTQRAIIWSLEISIGLILTFLKRIVKGRVVLEEFGMI